jgi:hypothetical protein
MKYVLLVYGPMAEMKPNARLAWPRWPNGTGRWARP